MLYHIRQMLLSPAGYALYDAMIHRPEECVVRSCGFLLHIPSNTSFRVANGGWFFDGIDGAERSIGLMERHYLYCVFKKMQSRSVAAQLKPPVLHHHKDCV